MSLIHVPKSLSRSSQRLSGSQLSTAWPNLAGSTRSGRLREAPASGYSRRSEHGYDATDASTHSHARTVNTQTAVCVSLLVLFVVVVIAKLAT